MSTGELINRDPEYKFKPREIMPILPILLMPLILPILGLSIEPPSSLLFTCSPYRYSAVLPFWSFRTTAACLAKVVVSYLASRKHSQCIPQANSLSFDHSVA